ncbi:MAG: anti-sigma factor [Pirellulaceae bacterium]|nr:anti-sigma factor [Pirellulaceae bacterium]
MRSDEYYQQLMQQLVSGELSGPEYRRALAELDAQPDRWRDCALAFLQEQAVTQELQALAGQSVDWQQGCASRGSSAWQVDLQSKDITAPAGSSLIHVKSYIESSHQWAAVAALVLLGIGVGWLASSIRDGAQQGSRFGSQMAVIQQPDSQNTDLARVDAVVPSNSQLEALNQSTGSVNRWVIDENLSNNPADIGNSWSQWLQVDSQIPDRLKELERTGKIRVSSSSALIPINYDNGTSVLVPVQQLHIEPTVFSY